MGRRTGSYALVRACMRTLRGQSLRSLSTHGACMRTRQSLPHPIFSQLGTFSYGLAHFLQDVRAAYGKYHLQPHLVVRNVTADVRAVRVEAGHVDRCSQICSHFHQILWRSGHSKLTPPLAGFISAMARVS